MAAPFVSGALGASRFVALAAILGLWIAAGAARLIYLQVFQYGEYLARAQRQQQRTIEVSPKRGAIYDRNSRELAMSVSVDSVFAVPAEIPAPENTATLLARVLNTDAAELLTRMKSSRSFCWVKRKVDNLEAERVRALNLRGVYLQKENKRFYPKRELAAHVLGYVGVDENGLAGVELTFDSSVRGRPGKLLILTDARRRWFGRTERAPDAGDNLILTIDEKIQYIVERELSAVVGATHAKAATIIVSDPTNGEVLAMANRPTYNPNRHTQHPPESWVNRAVAAAYEPGSTFKIITVAAALEERLTRPGEVIDCQMGAIYIAGHRIGDHKAFGLLDVNHIVANSSGVGAIKLGIRLGDDRMYRYLRAFGFGASTGIELPGEARGLTKPPARWSKISIGAISMGQEIGVSPIQLLTAVNAMANGGWLHRPRIVRQRFHHAPNAARPGMLYAAAPESERSRVVSAETAEQLKRMLQLVVLDGTGKKAQLNGWSAAGKTGTAQKADPATGGYSRTDYVASFVGFAPVNQPAISIAVILDSPRGDHGGGTVAAPVFKRIAELVLAYLEVPHDLPVAPGTAPKAEIDVAQLRDWAPAEPAVAATGWRIPMAAPPAQSTVVLDLEGANTVPDFLGKPVRAVAEQAVAAGFDIDLVGSGIAREQWPSAGSGLAPGSRIRVRFR